MSGDADYTASSKAVIVSDAPGRAECFVKFEDDDTRQVTILRDEDAEDLRDQLDAYLAGDAE